MAGDPSSAERVELLQFAYSHFNEKARWGLDWKGVPHDRTTYLPGPHMPLIRRVTGDTLVPVVRFGRTVVPGSNRILEELERRYPEKPLDPDDAELRERALEIQRHFDDVVGPLVRRSLFAVFVDELPYMSRVFAGHKTGIVRTVYGATLPLLRSTVEGSMGIRGPETIEEADRGTAEALDFVARESASTGYLVGSSFTVADLTAAALLAPAADPPGPMRKPDPKPPAIERWLERWRDHPGTAWVTRMYEKHRPEDTPGGVR